MIRYIAVCKCLFAGCILIFQSTVAAQVFDNASADCREWLEFNTSSDSSNQIYFNNVFGQYSAYDDLSALPDDKQCIWLTGDQPVGWSYNWPEIDKSDSRRYSVKAFPEVIYGIKGEANQNPNKSSSDESGFPVNASEVLDRARLFDVEFAYQEYMQNEVARNVAIEAFFHDVDGDCSAIRSDNRALEIMIWSERPSNEFTITENLYAQGVSIQGYTWNVYSRKTPQDYIVFEAIPTFSGSDIVSSTAGRTTKAEGRYNWNDFVEYVYDNQQGLNVKFDREYCMAGLEFGTEIWFGAGQFKIDRFRVSVSEGDSDNDGVANKADVCQATAEDEIVTIGSCATGVPNVVQLNGCSISDKLAACGLANSRCIAKVSNKLKKSGLITGREKGQIQRCSKGKKK